MTDDNFENFLQRAARDYNAPPSTPRDAMWARIEAERRVRSSTATSHGARVHRWLMVGAAIAAMLLVGIGIGYVWRGTMDSHLVAERQAAPDSARQQLAGTGNELAIGNDSGPDSGSRGAGTTNAGAATPDAQRLAVVTPDSRPGQRHSPESTAQPSRRDGGAPATSGLNAAYAALTAEHLGRVEMLLTSYRAESESGQVDPQISSWAGDLLGTTRLLLDSPGTSDPRMHKLLGDLEVVLTQITQLGAEQGQKKDELQLIDQSLRSHDVMTRIRGATPAGAGALPIGT